MVCVIAREEVVPWNRPTFKAPRLDMKLLDPKKPAALGYARPVYRA